MFPFLFLLFVDMICNYNEWNKTYQFQYSRESNRRLYIPYWHPVLIFSPLQDYYLNLSTLMSLIYHYL